MFSLKEQPGTLVAWTYTKENL